MTDREIALALAPVVRKAAAFMLAESKTFTLDQVELKNHSELVSYVDKESEQILVDGIRAFMPEAGFILEEGGLQESDREVRWIIDPLDGTTNFTRGLPCWSISVAMQRNGQTVLGVVYDVPHDEYFEAIQGQGATCNGQPIRVSRAETLAQSLMATGFPYAKNDRKDDLMAVFSKIRVGTLGVRRFGSAAIDLAWTACGRFDGYYEMNIQAWDVAAGALLVQEAGGTVTDFSGTDNFVFGRKIAATNGIIHSEVLDILQAHF
jgi:myo-inositol-1(or 4)-monophosphatase